MILHLPSSCQSAQTVVITLTSNRGARTRLYYADESNFQQFANMTIPQPNFIIDSDQPTALLVHTAHHPQALEELQAPCISDLYWNEISPIDCGGQKAPTRLLLGRRHIGHATLRLTHASQSKQSVFASAGGKTLGQKETTYASPHQ